MENRANFINIHRITQIFLHFFRQKKMLKKVENQSILVTSSHVEEHFLLFKYDLVDENNYRV